MAHSTTGALTAELLERAPALPPQVLRTAWGIAAKTGDRTLQLALAAREDAPADMVAEIAETDDPLVAGIYAARRTKAPGVAVRDLRASSLAKALQTGEVRPEVIAAAREVILTKPTRTLADALLRVDAQWFAPEHAAAILTHASLTQPGHVDVGKLADRLGPEHAPDVLRQTCSVLVLKALAWHDLPAADLAAALVRVVSQTELHTQTWVSSPAKEAVGVTIRRMLGASRDLIAMRDTLLMEPGWRDADEGKRNWTFHHITREADSLNAGLKRRLASQPWDIRPPLPVDAGTGPDYDSPAAAASCDPAVLHKVVAALTATAPRPALRGGVIRALLTNPALTRPDTVTLLEHLVAARMHPMAFDLEGVNPIAAHPGDTQIAGLWATLRPVQALTFYGWAPFGGQDQAPGLLTEWQAAFAEGWLPENTYVGLLPAVCAHGLTPEILRALTIPTIRIWLARDEAYGLFATAVARLLTDTLGDDPNAWAAFDAVAEAGERPLGELLDAASAVCA